MAALATATLLTAMALEQPVKVMPVVHLLVLQAVVVAALDLLAQMDLGQLAALAVLASLRRILGHQFIMPAAVVGQAVAHTVPVVMAAVEMARTATLLETRELLIQEVAAAVQRLLLVATLAATADQALLLSDTQALSAELVVP